MRIDIIKKTQDCHVLSWMGQHTLHYAYYAVHCTQTDTADDGLANTAVSLSRDLQHTISCKHKTKYKLAYTHTHTHTQNHSVSTAGCVQLLSSVRKQCLLVIVLQIWT